MMCPANSDIVPLGRTHFQLNIIQIIMRLMTHNFLRSNVKGTENGYPLLIEVTALNCIESSSVIDKDLLLGLLPKINYPALLSAIQQVSPHCHPPLEELPTELPTNVTDLDNVTMANLNRALFDVYLVEGYLICPDTGRRFPVKDGIPNMILHEDEI